MRSLFAKFFVCMLLVPVLARSGGALLYTALGEPQPDTERLLQAVLTPYAQTLGAVLDEGGPVAAAAVISANKGRIGDRLSLRLVTSAARDCADQGLDGPGDAADRSRSVAVPVPNSRNSPWPLCLVATVGPRPHILGVLPASWWALLPLAELLTCGVVSFFLARYLARPIGQIRAAAVAFANGDLTARAGTKLGRRDEAADLVRDFDRMADRVAASMEAQQRFIGDVSHEMKSPLARLSMALGLARREAGGAAAPRFDRMERELETVSRLVRELLVLSSLRGSTAPRQSVPVDLAAVVQEAADDLTFQWRERAHVIRLITPGGPVWVSGDSALLRRVVENVLGNALFYTPDGTEVEAILDRAGLWARFVVRDRGPGVPPAALPHLFEPFYRVDEARARNTGGVGLGLAISKRAVELHGGHIGAVNADPGLAVRIELPALEVDARSKAMAAPARQDVPAIGVSA